MNKEKLTINEVLNWNGEDGERGLAEYLCAILNGEWSAENAYDEIKDYNKE